MIPLRPIRTLPSPISSVWLMLLLLVLLLCVQCLPAPAQTAPTLEGPVEAAKEILTGDDTGPAPASESLPAETSVSVSTRISGEEKEFPAGEPFEVLVELRVEGGGPPIRLRGYPELDLSSNLEHVDTGSGSRWVPGRNGVTETQYIRYTIVGNAQGDGTVKPADVEFLVPGEENPRSLPVPAVTVSIRPPLNEGPALWQILLVTVGIPAAVLAVVGAILIARMGKSAREGDTGIGEEPAWKRELDEARRKRFEGDPRAYLRDLYDVLRRGTAEQCGFEGTPGVGDLKARIEEKAAEGSSLREAVRLLEELDAARYAPETPPLEDLDRAAKRIGELLENDRDPSRD